MGEYGAIYLFVYVIFFESVGVGDVLLVLSAGYELIAICLSSAVSVWEGCQTHLLQ